MTTDYRQIELPTDKSGGLVTCDFCYETVISPILTDCSKELLPMYQGEDGLVICQKCKDDQASEEAQSGTIREVK